MNRRMAAVLASALLAGCAATHAAPSLPDAPRRPPATVPHPSTTIDLSAPERVGALRITTVAAPIVFAPRAQWLRIARPDGVVQYAAVYRPARNGRHPGVVYLHGSTGLEDLELAWASRFAARGFVVVAGCYLDAPASNRFVPCPTLPRGEPLDPGETKSSYETLVAVAGALPDVQPGPVGVVGVSYGAIAALSVADARVGAIVADSGYGKAGTEPVRAPVLLLAWSVDGHVAHERVAAFEAALRRGHAQVSARYYPGAGHVPTLAPPPVGSDATDRAAAFLRRYLASGASATA